MSSSEFSKFCARQISLSFISYYLSYIPMTRGWRSVLSAQKKSGPALCVMYKNMNGDINVDYMTERWETQLHQKSHVPGQNHRYFEGPDHKEYHWRGAGAFSLSNDIQVSGIIGRFSNPTSQIVKCFDSDNKLIAKYVGRTMSLKKDGVLVVQPVRGSKSESLTSLYVY